MCPHPDPALFFRQGRGSDRRLRLVPSASRHPCDCRWPLLPPPSSHSACEWHRSMAVSLGSHGSFYRSSFLAFSSHLLSLVAGNAHPLVCPNREVSLPEQTSPWIALFLYGICRIFSLCWHIKSVAEEKRGHVYKDIHKMPREDTICIYDNWQCPFKTRTLQPPGCIER